MDARGAEDGDELTVGEVVSERYRVEGHLGRGGSGSVYGARHTWTRRPVALKVLRADHATASGVERFLREARIAGELRHENIVEVLDMGLRDGLPFLVLERLEGESLDARLARGRLTMEEALAVAQPVARGLAALHDAGVVHRDVKPENVFLHVTQSGQVVPKLLDFGISKRLDVDGGTLTHERALLGTPHYMSPEQIDAPGRVGPPSDVWSMGALLAEALSGDKLFDVGGLTAILHAIGHGPPVELDEGVPAPVRAVVERALERDPDRRYEDGRALGEALAAAMDELGCRPDALPSVRRDAPNAPPVEDVETIAPAPEDVTTEAAGPRSRRGLVIGLAAAIALAGGALALGVVGAATRDEAPTPPEVASSPPPGAPVPSSPAPGPAPDPAPPPAMEEPTGPEASPHGARGEAAEPPRASARPARGSARRRAPVQEPDPATVRVGANRSPIITD